MSIHTEPPAMHSGWNFKNHDRAPVAIQVFLHVLIEWCSDLGLKYYHYHLPPLSEVASWCGVKSKSTVLNWMREAKRLGYLVQYDDPKHWVLGLVAEGETPGQTRERWDRDMAERLNASH
jgi:hypothetical protein